MNVFPIEIPPLRERREDIPLLIHYFVSRLSRRMQKRTKSISKQTMNTFVNADWPGNIRELENFIERCVILTQGDSLQIPYAEIRNPVSGTVIAASRTFEETERQVIINALKAASDKVAGRSGAAERLGLKRTTLQNKMRRLNVTHIDTCCPCLSANVFSNFRHAWRGNRVALYCCEQRLRNVQDSLLRICHLCVTERSKHVKQNSLSRFAGIHRR